MAQTEATVSKSEEGRTILPGETNPITIPVVVNESEPSSGATASSEVKEAGGSGVDESLATTPAASVNVVLSQPKTTEELIAARALKRAARKSAIREKAEGHKRTGDILFEANKYKAAYPHYLEAIQLWGSNPTYFISLAGAYRKLQWYEEAAHAATRALTLDPKNSEARYVRGVARMEQRLLKPARLDFETVLEHDLSHLRARAALTEVSHFIATSGQLGTHELGPNPIEELVKDVDFGFPHYEQDALEIASVSDSSDCNHVGNGVQCRFYNHEGCARGTACLFSHAPDEKSVRDELGRNVCIYHLLDSCKFGASKCIYSHSKEALPKSGWWTSPEQIAKVKSVIEVAEQKAREQRHLESERWKAHIKALKAAGKQPKSAGVKSAEKKGGEEKDAGKQEVEGGNAKEVSAADTGIEKKVEGEKITSGKESVQKKKPEGQKRKPQAGKRKKSFAAAAPAKAAGVPVAPTDSPEAESKSATVADPATTTPGFTDYQLNVPPADVKPLVQDAPVALSY
ncbi:hypothetical protein BDZ97DRAFT_1798841 [Flammula alnicola]|nr:hypothetical protein BDZ97DRAFT_1798841 [Flammula alnicola]